MTRDHTLLAFMLLYGAASLAHFVPDQPRPGDRGLDLRGSNNVPDVPSDLRP